jgi:hypothetical protein
MNTQIQIDGTYPHSFDSKDVQLTGSNHIVIDADTQLVKVRYEGSETKFDGGTIEAIDGWVYHTFTETGYLNEK